MEGDRLLQRGRPGWRDATQPRLPDALVVSEASSGACICCLTGDVSCCCAALQQRTGSTDAGSGKREAPPAAGRTALRLLKDDRSFYCAGPIGMTLPCA